MTRQVAFNSLTNVATIQEEGTDPPEGSVDIGTFDETDDSKTVYQHVADLLYKRSEADASQEAHFPDNITDTAYISIISIGGTVEELVIADISLDPGTEGEDYEFTVSASGGVPPYTYSLVDPPEGMTIDEDTGEVTFEAPAADNYNFAARVEDMLGTIDTEDVELSIEAVP